MSLGVVGECYGELKIFVGVRVIHVSLCTLDSSMVCINRLFWDDLWITKMTNRIHSIIACNGRAYLYHAQLRYLVCSADS